MTCSMTGSLSFEKGTSVCTAMEWAVSDPLLSENFLLSSRSAQSSFCELECPEADVCDLTFERLMAEHDVFASTSLAGMAKLLGSVENRLEAMNRMADQYE